MDAKTPLSSLYAIQRDGPAWAHQWASDTTEHVYGDLNAITENLATMNTLRATLAQRCTSVLAATKAVDAIIELQGSGANGVVYMHAGNPIASVLVDAIEGGMVPHPVPYYATGVLLRVTVMSVPMDGIFGAVQNGSAGPLRLWCVVGAMHEVEDDGTLVKVEGTEATHAMVIDVINRMPHAREHCFGDYVAEEQRYRHEFDVMTVKFSCA